MVGVEAEGSDARIIDDLPSVIDEVDPRGSRRIEPCDPVVHLIDVERNDAVEKIRLTARGDFAPLFEGDGLLDIGARELAHQIIHESLGTRTTEPPSIDRMGFLYVDDDEFDLIVILLVEFFETHGPIAEGRSGVTAEYEGDRAFAAKVGEANADVALRIL